MTSFFTIVLTIDVIGRNLRPPPSNVRIDPETLKILFKKFPLLSKSSVINDCIALQYI